MGFRDLYNQLLVLLGIIFVGFGFLPKDLKGLSCEEVLRNFIFFWTSSQTLALDNLLDNGQEYQKFFRLPCLEHR